MKVFIDGILCRVSPGQTILESATRQGISIPHLCDSGTDNHRKACQLCLVEIEGKGIIRACECRVESGMRILTHSDRLSKKRRQSLRRILSDHYADCEAPCQIACPAHVDIQTYLHHIAQGDYRQAVRVIKRHLPLPASTGRICPAFCESECRRSLVDEAIAIRALKRHAADQVLDDESKEPASLNPLITDKKAAIIGSGPGGLACAYYLRQLGIDAALYEAMPLPGGWLRYGIPEYRLPKAVLTPVSTLCTYCGVGCQITLYVDKPANRIRYVEGDPESEVNRGMLCVKGRFGYDFNHDPHRLTTPLIRKEGRLQPAGWEEAIRLIAQRFKELKASYGADALAGFASAKVTNEENYLFQKFIRRELGTNNVDHCARLCHASTVTGLEASLGNGAMTNDIAGIACSDVIFIIGSDTSAAHPIIASHIKNAVRHGARLIVADPKRIEMADHASLYVAHRPGTDVMLLNGIMQQIVINAWYDEAYIRQRVDGFEAFLMEVMSDAYLPEKVELVTGVPVNDILRMAEMIGTA